MKYFIYIFIFFTGIACSSSKEISEPTIEVQSPPKPNWLKEDPISSEYYIGIGFGNKSNPELNYREQAKKNALNDLASQIEVKITSNSFLFTMESSYSFNEDFKSTIQTEISKDLSGFELVDSWEDESTYAVYFRLSKALYQKIKKEQKQEALRFSYNLYKKALVAETNNDFTLAVNMNAKALIAIEKYWNEINEFISEEGTIYLDTEIYSSLGRLLNGLKFISNDAVELSHKNSFSSDFLVQCSFNNTALSSLPLRVDYFKIQKSTGYKTQFRNSLSTNDKGEVKIIITEPHLSKENQLNFELDVKGLLSLDKKNTEIMTSILSGINKSKRTIPFSISYPSINIVSKESVLGKETSNKVLERSFKSALIKNNYSFVEGKNKSELTLQIVSNTTASPGNSNFVPAYLNGEITLVDNESGNIIFTKPLSNVKGVHTDGEKASIKAYEEASQIIEIIIVEELINSLTK